MSGDFTLSDAVVYVRSGLHVKVLHARSGRYLWQFTEGRGVFRPVVAGGVVYLDGFGSGTGVNVFYAIARSVPDATPTAAKTPGETP